MQLTLPNGEQKPVEEVRGIVPVEGGVAIEFSLKDLPAAHLVIVKRTESFEAAQKIVAELARQLLRCAG